MTFINDDDFQKKTHGLLKPGNFSYSWLNCADMADLVQQTR